MGKTITEYLIHDRWVRHAWFPKLVEETREVEDVPVTNVGDTPVSVAELNRWIDEKIHYTKNHQPPDAVGVSNALEMALTEGCILAFEKVKDFINKTQS